MNGSYEIEKADWEKLDSDTKTWMIFNTFNEHREGYHKHKTFCETRFCNIEGRMKYLKTGVVALVCFLSGAGVIGGKDLITVVTKLFGI